MDRADDRQHLPLSPVDLLVLMALVDRDRHGYGVRQDLLEMTDGDVDLDAGNLYRSLRRLMERGLVERLDAQPGADPRRRDYRLSATGREVASAEVGRLDRLLALEPARRLRSQSSS